MLVKRWQPGHSFQSPVYLDANVLVGYVVSNHDLYKSCKDVVGELLMCWCAHPCVYDLIARSVVGDVQGILPRDQ